MKKLRNKKGFTLIELIVVIAILAVLALILIPSISNYVAQARDARNEANARALFSEVTANVAFGTITAGGSVSSGTGTDAITCDFTLDDGVVDSFDCTVDGEPVDFEMSTSTFTN